MLSSLIFWIVIILLTVTLHEVAHGFVAFLRGDRTAFDAGRLTLNPFKHIDLFWTVLLPAVLWFSTGGRFAIGMAKPVPVNFLNLRSPRRDMIWVALAGPLANLLLAGLLSLIYHFFPFEPLLYAIYFNLGLAVFNLIPIPPLDGSRVVAGLLPARLSYHYGKIEAFGFWIILALYFLGALWVVVIPVINFFTRFLDIPQLTLEGP